jgi:two-component system CheB/CheR fusion protein
MAQRAAITPPQTAGTAPPVSELCPLILQQLQEYALFLLDTDGAILWANPSAQILTGHRLDDVSGKKGEILFTPEDVARGVFAHEMTTAAAQGSMENDRWMMRADGSRYWADGVMFPLRNADGEIAAFAKMLRDRTDVKQQLRWLGNEIALLVEQGRQKDQILAVAAHELRNPLFATTVAVDALHRMLSGAGELQQAFDVINRQLQAIRRLLDDITDAAQADAGKLRIKRERLDFRDIIRQALETMRPAIVMRRHTVNEVLLPVEIPIEGDRVRLQQTVQTLIDNAVKYTPSGGTIGIEATIEGNQAVLKVEDNGVGVAPEMQAHIFDLFTQVPAADSLDEKGLGIGLCLVKNIVLRLDGTVQVRSNGVGKGSEFSIRLPLAGEPSSSSPANQPDPPGEFHAPNGL